MTEHENFKNTESATEKVTAAPLSSMMAEVNINDIFKKAGPSDELLKGLPSAKDLLDQIFGKDEKSKTAESTQADGQDSTSKVKHASKPATIDFKPSTNDAQEKDSLVPKMMINVSDLHKGTGKVSDLLKGIGETIVDQLEGAVKEGEARQRKIADQALRDPNTQKVSEKHEDGPIATVVIEKRDGSVVTHKPEGTKITKHEDGYKVTEYPKEINPEVASVHEYPNGAVETKNRDGSFIFKDGKSGEVRKYDLDGTVTEFKKDGTQVIDKQDKTRIIITPDGTKTSTKPDGTEIVEKKNGDRTVSRPDKTEADGTKVWNKDDGTVVREAKDGTKTTTFPKDVNETTQSRIEHPNGDYEQVQRDGSRVKISKDGKITVTQNDGSAVSYDKKGNMEQVQTNGTRTKLSPDGTFTVSKKDDSVSIFHPNGIKETLDHGGTRVITTPEGFSARIDHNGKVQYRLPKEQEEMYNKVKDETSIFKYFHPGVEAPMDILNKMKDVSTKAAFQTLVHRAVSKKGA